MLLYPVCFDAICVSHAVSGHICVKVHKMKSNCITVYFIYLLPTLHISIVITLATQCNQINMDRENFLGVVTPNNGGTFDSMVM